MQKFTLIIVILIGSLFNQSILAQKSDVLLQHYKNEYQTFKEFIAKNSTFKGDTNIDVHFYHLDISIGISSPYIEGSVQCVFEPVTENIETIRLDLNRSLTVDNISSPCESFFQDEDDIVINLDGVYNPGEILELTIGYHGVPVLALGYKGLRYETHDESEPIIATLSTPYLAHYWYPCKDGPEDKADSVYVDITIPDTVIMGNELIAVSNGILENTIDNGMTKTFQWRHRYPIVTYYVMAAISNYVHFQEIFNGNSGESFPCVLDLFVVLYGTGKL